MLDKKTLAAAALFASASLASATDITISPGQSIQAAIVQAVNGDRVLVQPGVYSGPIDFLGKDIQVIGMGGSAATILDGAGAAITLVTFKTSEPATAVLSDFTVRDASVGIFVKDPAHPTLRRLIVEGHKILGQPSGGNGINVASWSAYPHTQVEECIVRDNEGSGIAGPYFEVVRSVISGNQNTGVVDPSYMRECLITGNVGENGGGVQLAYNTIDRCVITNNTATKNGGGVYSYMDEGVSVTNCEIAGNHAGLEGGGIYAYAFHWNDDAYYPTINVQNCLIHDNTASSAAGLYAYADKLWSGFPRGAVKVSRTTFAGNVQDSFSYHASIRLLTDCVIWNQGSIAPFTFGTSYCDIESGPAGDHNLSLDPQFVDAANGDYHLRAASPCIGAGSPTLAKDFERDAPVGVADMGADEFAPHLYVPGLVSAGGPMTINTIGVPGAPVLLFASLSRTEPGVATPYGFFALGFPLLPAFPLSLGPIASNSRVSISATVPSFVPVGTVIHMQAFVGGASPALTLPLTILIN